MLQGRKADMAVLEMSEIGMHVCFEIPKELIKNYV